jgi:hypothetical protein
MLAFAVLLFTGLINAVAQMPPPPEGPPQGPPGPPEQPPMSAQPLEDGPCLDSSRAVPRVVGPPVSRATQIVRIDQVLSTATMTPGEIIGFLYTTQDGSTWLGERSAAYSSPADATAINQVLSSTHEPNQNVNDFPPQSRYGVPTRLPQLFRVSIPPDAMRALRIALAPCVLWPPGRPLPDPMM